MNREIKFRGKSLATGEWLHGSHFNDGAEDYILPNLPSGAIDYESYQVDQNTIGQFTGLLDKNGKEIYEGDIVEVYDFTSVYARKYQGVVKMIHCTWVVVYEWMFGIAQPNLDFDDFANKKTKVIGNEFDNPDLIKSFERIE